MNQAVYFINIWVNEERYRNLEKVGLQGIAKNVLAGLKVIQVPATEQQKDSLLNKFPRAKCDTATTRTIELLPREIKDEILALVIQKGNLNVLSDFLNQAN